MTTKIQLRRDTAAAWTAANPVLANGEPGWETDTKLLKIGDGATAWASLPYYQPGTGSVPAASWARVRKTADQNLAAATFVPLTWSSEDADTSAYHDNTTNPERLTVPAAGVYVVSANVYYSFVSGGTSGERILELRRNGTTVARVEGTSGGAHAELATTGPIACAAGDYFTAVGYIETGTWAATSTISWFSIHRIGG